MPVLPFHHYIGPGNKSDNGQPVDEDDKIAREHDIKYDNATSAQDVRKADLEAILLFRQNWIEGNWHSLIGDIGLSVKYGIESYTGVIYPKIPEFQLGNNVDCQIAFINKFLKLQCEFKPKLLIKNYKTIPYILYDKKIQVPKVLDIYQRETKIKSLLPLYFFVPLNLPEHFFKCHLSRFEFNIINDIHYEYFLKYIWQQKGTPNEALKILNYMNIVYFIGQLIKKNRIDKQEINNHDNNINAQTTGNIVVSIHQGHVFIDQDWNLHFENMN